MSTLSVGLLTMLSLSRGTVLSTTFLFSFVGTTLAGPLFSRAHPAISESSIPFAYQNATYTTYTKLVGDLSSDKTPLVVVHGGPGLSHDYLLPLADLSDDSNIPVIFYDQIGNARSTHLDGVPETFWSFDLFVAELQNVIAHYGVAESFNLLGHSWGGVLSSEFVVRTQPTGLNKLVLTDSLASGELWAQSLQQILQTFPEDVQQSFEVGTSDLPRYKAALETVYAVHGCTISPWPQDLVFSVNQAFEDPTVMEAP
jgi:proline-specific peptidase